MIKKFGKYENFHARGAAYMALYCIFSHWKDTQDETTLCFIRQKCIRVNFYCFLGHSRVIPIVKCNNTVAFSFNYEPQKNFQHIVLNSLEMC